MLSVIAILQYQYASVAVVEEYIPGREIRVGVVEIDGKPHALMPMEYHVSEERPIRTLRDKLDVSDDGDISESRWEQPTIPSTCPAEVEPKIYQKMSHAALALHGSLSSRDFSLYDFRVNSDGDAFLLESCPFWSFSSRSILSMMIKADSSLDLDGIIRSIWTKTAERKGVSEKNTYDFLLKSA